MAHRNSLLYGVNSVLFLCGGDPILFSDRLGIGATLICFLRADEVVFDEKKLLQLGVSVTATVNLSEIGK